MFSAVLGRSLNLLCPADSVKPSDWSSEFSCHYHCVSLPWLDEQANEIFISSFPFPSASSEQLYFKLTLIAQFWTQLYQHDSDVTPSESMELHCGCVTITENRMQPLEHHWNIFSLLLRNLFPMRVKISILVGYAHPPDTPPIHRNLLKIYLAQSYNYCQVTFYVVLKGYCSSAETIWLCYDCISWSGVHVANADFVFWTSKSASMYLICSKVCGSPSAFW